MPHTRYTKYVRKRERARLTQQERELSALARVLHRLFAEPVVVPQIELLKDRRRARLAASQLHESRRTTNAA